MLDAKLLRPRSLMQTATAYRGPLIIGTFEKPAPGALLTETGTGSSFISSFDSPLCITVSTNGYNCLAELVK